MKRNPVRNFVSFFAILALIGTVLAGCAGGTKERSAAEPTKVTTTAPTGVAGKNTDKPKKAYKIALSNSFAGNSWRAEMLNIFEAYAQNKKDAGEIAEFYASSAGNDAQAQIDDIRNMMSKGFDAILVDASFSTALVPVLNEAVGKGIVVVTFDNTVDSDKVYNVNTDQVQLGRVQAQWLMEQIGGKGNILLIRGIEGTSIDHDRDQGHREVLAKYPGVNVLQEGFGNYDDETTSVVINSMLTSQKGKEIDGILTQGGGENAIVEALKQHKIDPATIPLTGEMLNGLFRQMKENNVKAIAAGQPPFLSASALDVALKVLKGEQVDKKTMIPLSFDDYRNVNKWYVAGQPDHFYVNWTDPPNSFNLTIGQILKK